MPINLSGTWKLDVNRSESLIPYLSALVGYEIVAVNCRESLILLSKQQVS